MSQRTPREAKRAAPGAREARSHSPRGREAPRGWHHPRGAPPRVDRQPRRRPQAQRRPPHVCRLHQPQQGLPQGSLPAATDRPDRGLHRWVRAAVLSGRLLRLPPDQDGSGRRGEDGLHHPLWRVLLRLHAHGPEERRGHLPEADAHHLGAPDGEGTQRPTSTTSS